MENKGQKKKERKQNPPIFVQVSSHIPHERRFGEKFETWSPRRGQAGNCRPSAGEVDFGAIQGSKGVGG